MKLTAVTITDEQCQAVARIMPSPKTLSLLAGAMADVEPHRNHSRWKLAKLWVALACEACTLQHLDSANAQTGCIFVGWGHGWQPCQTCGGSGLSAMGNDLIARQEPTS